MIEVYYRLETSGRLYIVPQGCLDDYFWLLASVSEQSNCQADEVEKLQRKGNKQRAGNRPFVMTNDQVRDHQQFDLLEPKLFNRWYSSTIINYNFTGFVNEECVDPEIAFTPADNFSREIQSNKMRNEGKNEANCWHFPVQDWEPSHWFCVRLPSSEM